MAETTNLNIRIDKDLKERAEAVFADMGMSMTTAFNIFGARPCGRAKSPLRFTQTHFTATAICGHWTTASNRPDRARW